MSLFPSQSRILSTNTLHSVVRSLQSLPISNSSSVFLSLKYLKISRSYWTFILYGWMHLMFPHDQKQDMHSWQEYNGNDAVFSVNLIQGYPRSTIVPLVMLTLIICPGWCLPGFTTDNASCFYCILLQSCGELFQYCANILILMKPPCTRLGIHWKLLPISTTITMAAKLWISISIIPSTFISWHSTLRVFPSPFIYLLIYLSTYFLIDRLIHSYITFWSHGFSFYSFGCNLILMLWYFNAHTVLIWLWKLHAGF